MRGLRNVFVVLVCLSSPMGLCGKGATAHGPAFQHASTPIPRPGEVVSGITVTLEATAPPLLRVEVCGPDATRLRHGFPLVVELSAPVRGVMARHGDGRMAVGATAEGHRARVTLSRDPFLPPAPWQVVMLLTVEGNLGDGALVVGAARYPLPTSLPVGRPTVVWGGACDARYADQGHAPVRRRGDPGAPVDTT